MLAVWTSIGPGPIVEGQTAGLTAQQNPVSGAVNVVAPHPTDSSILYVGAVNGGVWRTNNATAASPIWVPLTDNQASLSIGDLQFDPTDQTRNTLIAGIGAFSSIGDAGNRTGVLRTIDGGTSWTQLTGGGLLLGKNITSVAGRGDVIVVAVNGATPFTLENVGIFRSTDGGSTFTHINGASGSGLPSGRTLEMVGDPTDPQVLYSSLTDAGASNGIYKSSDQGATWNLVSSAEMNALILDTGNRTNNVQMSVGQTHNVYVGIINGGQLAGFFRSGNGGGQWAAMEVPQTNEQGTFVGLNPIENEEEEHEHEETDDPGGQGGVHFSVVADPGNPNIVYVGGDRQPRGANDLGQWPNSIGATNFTGRLFRGDASSPTGSQWTPLTDNFADPDGAGPLLGTGPHADSRDMAFDAAGNLVEGDDGGVYKRVAPTSATGVWSSLIGNLQITEFVSVAYSQLTHTAFGGAQDTGAPMQVSSGGTQWLEIRQGDGGFVGVDDLSLPGQSIRYGSNQNLGAFGRVIFDASNSLVSFTIASLNGLTDAPQFYSPLEINKVLPKQLVIGTRTHVFESLDQGENVTDLGNVGEVLAMAYGGAQGDALNPGVLYVGTDQGLFFRPQSGAVLQLLASYPGDEPKDIAVDPEDYTHAVVIDTGGVFLTTNAGASWTEITSNLVDSRLRTVEFIATSSVAGIAVGGNDGVHVLSSDPGSIWKTAATGLPHAPVIDLHYNQADDVLLAGTLGRGAWIVSDGSSVLLPPGFSISDFSASEGDTGLTNFVFTVTQPASEAETSVSYSTIANSALTPSDFAAQSGSFTFLPGETSKQITIKVVGDTVFESDEEFIVRLSNPTGAVIQDGDGVGRILNDDISFFVNDASVVEGNAGGRTAVFTIYTLGNVNRSVSINYSTLDGSAVAGLDYQPRAGAISFGPGGGTTDITVPILADRLNESTESFRLVLLNPVNAQIGDGEGVATILDDDPTPSLYINDVNVTTTEAGTLAAVFTVALDAPSGQNVSVNVATSDNTAFSSVDYQGLNSVLQFAPGVTTQTVTVPVLTSDLYSPNKTFLVNLFGAWNARLADSQGIGRIIFAPPTVGELILDDGDAGYSHSSSWTNLTNTLSYGLDYEYHAAGNGNGSATWTFNNVPTGAYEVFAKWIPFSNRATNAPYTVLDGGATLGTVLVNQQLFPTGEQSNGITWQSLGMFNTSTGTLAVQLHDNANGYVIADAIRLVRDGILAQVPEMDVAAFGRSVSTGDATPSLDDGTDFGIVASQSNSVTHTFTVANNGNAALHLTGSPRVQVSGDHAGDFTVITQPSAAVAAGYGATFQILFHPTAEGLRQALISIANDDDNERPYTFHVQGTGAAAGPSQFIIDDQGSGFLKSANWATNVNSYGYGNSVSTVAGGNGSNWARWTFGGLAPGEYDVYATWVAFGNRATGAPFTLADGNVSQQLVHVNQQKWPATPINGTNWGDIGSIDVTTGELTVKLTDLTDGTVVADAVMVVRHDAPQQSGALLAHNAAMPLDVNGDSHVSSFDALLVINSLLSGSAGPQAVSLTAGAGYYSDVSGDGQVSSRDALLVISHLLSHSSVVPQAEPSAAALASGDSSPLATVAAPDAELEAIDAALSQLAEADTAQDEPLFSAAPITAADSSELVSPPAANPWVVASVFAESDAEDEENDTDSLLVVLSE